MTELLFAQQIGAMDSKYLNEGYKPVNCVESVRIYGWHKEAFTIYLKGFDTTPGGLWLSLSEDDRLAIQ